MTRDLDRPAAAHYLSLGLGAALLLWLSRGLWFYFDEWEFLTLADRNPWAPHGEHWSTLPYLAYRALYWASGLRSYLPYLGVLLLLHLGVAHVLWRLIRRAGVGGWLATGTAAVFIVLGAGAEDILWAFQIGFVGSLLLGLIAASVLDADRLTAVRLGLAVVLLLLSLMSSGVGVAMVVLAGAVTLIRHGWPRTLVVVAPAGAAYLGWYLAIGRTAQGLSHLSLSHLNVMPAFLWAGLRGSLGGLIEIRQLGYLLVPLLAAWALLRGRSLLRASAVAPAAGAAAVAFFLMSGLGRAAYGAAYAASSRYVYIGAALLLPMIALALSDLLRQGAWTKPLIALLVLAAILLGAREMVRAADEFTAQRQLLKRHVLAAAARVRSGEPIVGTQPDPELAPPLDYDGLRRLIADHALPPE
jgi:hypothetical protein